MGCRDWVLTASRGMGKILPIDVGFAQNPPGVGAADSEATVIFGGSGFLGAHAVSMALQRADLDHPVVSASRSPQAGPLFGRHRAGPQFERVDAREPEALLAVLDGWRPARVIHCLALARGGACEEDPLLASLLNAQVPGQLARWCRRNGAPLVHVSTDLVFGDAPPPDPAGFREQDPPAPISAYGATKAAGEQAVLEACPRAVVVRLPLLYGASGGRELGASDSFLGAVELKLFTNCLGRSEVGRKGFHVGRRGWGRGSEYVLQHPDAANNG